MVFYYSPPNHIGLYLCVGWGLLILFRNIQQSIFGHHTQCYSILPEPRAQEISYLLFDASRLLPTAPQTQGAHV